MVTLTIFTPTYNRAHTLVRTYESLKKQSNQDFLWLIIDDGSTDQTSELVEQWQNEADFEIRYVYKENGGMHTAHNFAYELIDTELNVCVDSDDCMAENAVEKILNKWSVVRDAGYVGIVGLDADLNTGKIIGTRFATELKETTLSGFYVSGGKGDKKLVYRTEIIKQYPPYPVFEGEKYVALAYKYLLIDQDYKLAVLNEVLCQVEYQADGSSRNIFRQYINNPQGFAFWRTIQMKFPTSKFELIKNYIHYCSSKIIAKSKGFGVASCPNKLLELLCMPFGALLSAYIMYRLARGQTE